MRRFLVLVSCGQAEDTLVGYHWANSKQEALCNLGCNAVGYNANLICMIRLEEDRELPEITCDDDLLCYNLQGKI